MFNVPLFNANFLKKNASYCLYIVTVSVSLFADYTFFLICLCFSV